MDQLNMVLSLADQNNAWSAAQAQKQMDFQERMSNTAHQREIADLKASGLNPVLSAKLGGASTPSGASATADSSVIGAVVEILKEFSEGMMSSAASGFARGSADADSSDIPYGPPAPGTVTSDEMLDRQATSVKSGVSKALGWISSALYTKNPRTAAQRAGNVASNAISEVADSFGSFLGSALKKNGPQNPASGYYYMKNYETNGAKSNSVAQAIVSKVKSSSSAKTAAALKDYKKNPLKYW